MKTTFLIETIDGLIVYDFALELYNMLRNDISLQEDFDYKLVSTDNLYIPDLNTIPVGSVNFVEKYLKYLTGEKYKPINVPEVLREEMYLGREYTVGNTINDVENLNTDMFIKDEQKLKGLTSYVSLLNTRDSLSNDTTYILSGKLDILSEYRIFVFKNIIKGIRNYGGSELILPDPLQLSKMVLSYENTAPVAYTLDVAVTEEGTYVIEVHDFFSCGLYGFSSSSYPYMLSQWFYEYIKNNKIYFN